MNPAAQETTAIATESITFGGMERFWMPKLWHGMSFSAWLRLLARNRFRVAPRHWATALAITPAALNNSFLRLVQNAIYHKLDKAKLPRDPVFIIGHWRSGTTLLHELLGLDERLTFPTTYECFSPNHFLLTEKLVSQRLGFLLPSKRLPDNVEQAWDKPQEDEAALCNLGARSRLLGLAFPNRRPSQNDSYELDDLSAYEVEQWRRKLTRFLIEITLLRPRRIVLKSPAHTFRIKHLLRFFPDSRFLYIYRNPYEVFPSTRRLWTTLCRSQGLQIPNFVDLEERIYTTYEQMFNKFESTRHLIPPGRLCELRYEDLVEDPVDQLRRVYGEIDLGDFQSVEPDLIDYQTRMVNYRCNRYVLDPRERDEIGRRWHNAIQHYGYEPPN